MNNNPTKNNTLIKQVAVIICSTILIASLGWLVDSLMNANTEIQVLKYEVISLKEIMLNKTTDRYYRKDADSTHEKIDQQLRDIELRLRNLETRRGK